MKMNFYDDIAEYYDEVTNLNQRKEAAAAFVSTLLQRYPIADAVDVACGNGLYAIQLAEHGVKVTGVDISVELLKEAEKRAAAKSLSIDWKTEPMQNLAHALHEQQDAVLCMGNSVPHLLDEKDLSAAISNFYKSLRYGGVLVLQLLNYEQILLQGERIVGITRQRNQEFIRFYDFLPERLSFNVLTIKWQDKTCVHDLKSTMLYPYTRQELVNALERHNFRNISDWGGVDFKPYDPSISPTLMLTAEK